MTPSRRAPLTGMTAFWVVWVGWALGDPLPYLMTRQTATVEGESQLFFTDPVGSVIRLVPGGEEWLVVSYGG